VLKGAITYNRHDSLFVTTAANWGQARSYCQSAGYKLVSAAQEGMRGTLETLPARRLCLPREKLLQAGNE
jgi:hypothetical protein